MTAQEYQERISKVEEKIVKIEKRIKKWSEGLSEEAKEMAKKRCSGELTYKQWSEWFEENYRDPNVCNQESDYKAPNAYEYLAALCDLEEEHGKLEKYKNVVIKLANFEKEEKIPALVEFLNNWKKETKEYIIELANTLDELKEANYNLYLKFGISYTQSEEYQNNIGIIRSMPGIVRDIYDSRSVNSVDEKRLDNILEREATAKYKDLVKRISTIVGNIEDVSNLSIGRQSGELNGVVKGDKGKAKIFTIGAGGENTDIIVNSKHGQIYHYRVLVKPVKE